MRMIFLTASLLVGLSPMCMAGQVYKWVDAQGVTHFGAQPPEGTEATTVIKSAPPPAKPAAPPSGGVIGDQRPSTNRSRNRLPSRKPNSRRSANRPGPIWRNCRTTPGYVKT